MKHWRVTGTAVPVRKTSSWAPPAAVAQYSKAVAGRGQDSPRLKHWRVQAVPVRKTSSGWPGRGPASHGGAVGHCKGPASPARARRDCTTGLLHQGSRAADHDPTVPALPRVARGCTACPCLQPLHLQRGHRYPRAACIFQACATAKLCALIHLRLRGRQVLRRRAFKAKPNVGHITCSKSASSADTRRPQPYAPATAQR